MMIRVISNQMSVSCHLPHQQSIVAFFNILSDQEKRSMHIPLSQPVQKFLCIRCTRSVIKSQCDLWSDFFCLLHIRTHRLYFPLCRNIHKRLNPQQQKNIGNCQHSPHPFPTQLTHNPFFSLLPVYAAFPEFMACDSSGTGTDSSASSF